MQNGQIKNEIVKRFILRVITVIIFSNLRICNNINNDISTLIKNQQSS